MNKRGDSSLEIKREISKKFFSKKIKMNFKVNIYLYLVCIFAIFHCFKKLQLVGEFLLAILQYPI